MDQTIIIYLLLILSSGLLITFLYFLRKYNHFKANYDQVVTDLEESRSQHQLILQSVGEGILGLDHQNKISFVNSAGARILGYNMSEMLDLPHEKFMETRTNEEDAALMREVQWENKGNINEILRVKNAQFKKKDGGLVTVDYSRTPIMFKSSHNNYIIIFRDLSILEKARAEAQQYHKMIKAIINNANSLISVKDLKGKYLIANRALLHLCETDENEIIGKTDIDIFPNEFALKYQETDQKVIDTETAIHLEEDIPKDDELHTFVSTKFPLHDSAGNIYATCAISTDITERKQQEMQLQDYLEMLKLVNAELVTARKEAQQANLAKSTFLANMSHEIRTPLNGVIGMSALLYNTELSDKQKKYIDRINLSGKLLLDIINDIIDISKIEAGKLKLEKIPTNIHELMKEIGEIMSSRAIEKHVPLSIAYDPRIPRSLLVDPTRFRQIIVNLLGNAIKFTHDGYIIIHIKYLKQVEHKVLLRFEIQDTGVGIPDQSKELIFHNFSQADASTTRKFGGTGLGLAITKQLVDLMKGRIGVISSENEGSTFWFEIPFDEDPESNEKESTGWQKIGHLKGLSVLMVENIEINRKVYGEYFKSQEMSFQFVSTNEEALALVNATRDKGCPYQVIVFDADHEEKMNILEISHLIDKGISLNDTKLVMLSSIPKYSTEEIKKFGFLAILSKPIYPEELFQTFSNILGSKSKVEANN